MATTFDEYAAGAATTAIYPGRNTATGLAYAVLGLTGEAGELANQAKKVLRDDAGLIDPERRQRMRSELGDVLWYLAAVARELDIDLETVARTNLQKLERRATDGTLQGDGEYRQARPLEVGDTVQTSSGGRATVVQVSAHAVDEVCVSAAPGHRTWLSRAHCRRVAAVEEAAPRPGGLY